MSGAEGLRRARRAPRAHDADAELQRRDGHRESRRAAGRLERELVLDVVVVVAEVPQRKVRKEADVDTHRGGMLLALVARAGRLNPQILSGEQARLACRDHMRRLVAFGLLVCSSAFAPSVSTHPRTSIACYVQRAPKSAPQKVRKPSKFDKPRFDTGRDPERPQKGPQEGGMSATAEGGVKMIAFYATLPALFLGIQALGGNL